MKRSVFEGFARHFVRLVVLMVFLHGMAGVCLAQSGGISAQPATKAAAPLGAPEMATPTAQAGQSAATGERQRGGNHEGIKVHGHWVIEVKNPDGTVTARREFENSVQPLGMAYLASLIAGNSSPGGLTVLLNGLTTTFLPFLGVEFSGSQAGPCLPLNSSTAGTGGTATGTTCLLTTGPSGGLFTYFGYVCDFYQTSYNTANQLGTPPPAGQAFPCSTNLTVSAPTTITGASAGGASQQVQMMGSVTVTATVAGNVTDVETVYTNCASSVATSQCVGTYNPQTASFAAVPTSYNLFTERNLDGPANGDPAAVPYSPGQTIAVSVTISFQ
jgi:hypothetical protein